MTVALFRLWKPTLKHGKNPFSCYEFLCPAFLHCKVCFCASLHGQKRALLLRRNYKEDEEGGRSVCNPMQISKKGWVQLEQLSFKYRKSAVKNCLEFHTLVVLNGRWGCEVQCRIRDVKLHCVWWWDDAALLVYVHFGRAGIFFPSLANSQMPGNHNLFPAVSSKLGGLFCFKSHRILIVCTQLLLFFTALWSCGYKESHTIVVKAPDYQTFCDCEQCCVDNSANRSHC